MRRRAFIGLIGGAAAWPMTARTQQRPVPVIGYLSGRSAESETPLLAAFRRGLFDMGYLEPNDLLIEFRFGDGHNERLKNLATDLAALKPAVLIATDGPSALAAKAASSTTPIVFSSGFDPVTAGLVKSLNRPDGNLTGVNIFTSELGPKRLDILRQLVPRNPLIAFVINPATASSVNQVEQVGSAVRAGGQEILVLNADSPQDIEQTFVVMARHKAGAVLYGASVFFQVHIPQMVELAARYSIPAMYEWREFTAAGGLISYSPSRPQIYRQMGVYAGRILKGEKVDEMPVVQPTSFELVINLKTAKALGLVVPPTLLAIADDVID